MMNNHPLLMAMLAANACLVLLCTLYYMVYARYTFFSWNRWLLLLGLLLSVTIPFVRIRFFDPPPLVLQVAHVRDYVQPVEHSAGSYGLSWVSVLLLIYGLGVLYGLLRLASRLYSLFRLHRSSVAAVHQGIRFRKLSAPCAPFAFMGRIYLAPDQYAPDQLEAILSHERIHIQEGHTADMLLIALVQVFFWYNPWVLLLRHAMTQNLEYITDQRMVRQVMNRAQYQYSLLHTATHNQYRHMTNAFLFINLKTRINMMNKQHSRTTLKWSYLLALPLLATGALSGTAAWAQQQVLIQQTETVSDDMQVQTIAMDPTSGVQAQTKIADPPVHSQERKTQHVSKEERTDHQLTVTVKSSASTEQVKPGTTYTVVQTNGEELTLQVAAEEAGTRQAKVKPLIIIDGNRATEEEMAKIDPKQIIKVEVLKDNPDMVQQYGVEATDGVIKISTRN